ncbi:MAG: fibronectin type III domain-containing protein [Eubacterium sp.]|nr:fibronectin type III domain-containing protein [Eubacterium sp.]
MRIRKFVLGLCAVMMFSGAIVASQGMSEAVMAKGLKAPLVSDAGYGENGFKNSTKKLYLELSSTNKKFTGYKIYKRVKGTKKWKLAATVNKKKNFYTDKKVKAGKTYQYKVKCFYKSKKKVVYSKYSNIEKISAVNYDGKYTAKLLGTDVEKKEITLSVTSHKYNGNTIFKKTEESVIKENKKEAPFTFTQYSLDQKTWKDIPEKGIKVKAGKTIYLKGVVTENEKSVKFAEIDAKKAHLVFGDTEIKYEGCTGCHNDFSINFENGTGWAVSDWD